MLLPIATRDDDPPENAVPYVKPRGSISSIVPPPIGSKASFAPPCAQKIPRRTLPMGPLAAQPTKEPSAPAGLKETDLDEIMRSDEEKLDDIDEFMQSDEESHNVAALGRESGTCAAGTLHDQRVIRERTALSLENDQKLQDRVQRLAANLEERKAKGPKAAPSLREVKPDVGEDPQDLRERFQRMMDERKAKSAKLAHASLVETAEAKDVASTLPVPETAIVANSRTVRLRDLYDLQLVDLDDWPEFFDDMRMDVEAECRKYGDIMNVWVDEKSTRGNVYIGFATPTMAQKCLDAMDRRCFAGSIVSCEFFDYVWPDDTWIETPPGSL